ncbi:MAG: CPBP family intramembrane metalloprotease [Methanobacteriota archaeon]|nr:MAG: CPBP family intramembrane metalloprotease [Euryarchaeota archaeon]
MLTFAAYLAVCLGVLIIGVDIVAPEIGNHSYSLHIALVALIPIVTISGAALEAWYIFLVCAILASAGWLVLKSARKFLNEITMRGTPRDHSPFFDMCALMFAVLFINTVIVLLLMAMGDEPVAPTESMADWELLFLLANASVWEELIVRVLLLGLPLIVVDQARGMEARKPHKYVFGGGIKIMWGETALVIISSLVFGFAHFEAWGLWKIFPASIAGVAFGYMFLKHGLPAAVMLHFSFDYLSTPLVVFDASFAVQMIVAIGILLWVGLGFFFTIYFSIRIAEFLSGRLFFEGEKPTQVAVTAAAMPPAVVSLGGYTRSDSLGQIPEHSPQQSHEEERTRRTSAAGFFVCSFCGSTSARLDGERGLVCLGCGRSYK